MSQENNRHRRFACPASQGWINGQSCAADYAALIRFPGFVIKAACVYAFPNHLAEDRHKPEG